MKIIDIKQGSDEWHEERFRCVTGTRIESAIGACYSNAKDQWVMGGKAWEFQGSKLVCTKENVKSKAGEDKQNTLLKELVSECQSILEINDYCSAEMDRGNDLEPLSVEAASVKHGVKFESCGMLKSESLPNFKFSPDAICLSKTGAVVGGYETKSKAGSKHIDYIIKGKVPSEHLLQCLCPMIISDSVSWWIFGHFDDRNMVNNLFTSGIVRSDYEDFIQVARSVLKDFLASVDKAVLENGGYYNG